MSAIKITSANYETEVTNSDKKVLIDFWADWCGPCKMMSPVVDEIAAELPDVKVCKINVDEEEELAHKFNIMSIPTLIIMKNGEIADTSIGLTDKSSLINKIKNA